MPYSLNCYTQAAQASENPTPEIRMQRILSQLLEHELLTSLDHFHENQYEYVKQIRQRARRRLQVSSHPLFLLYVSPIYPPRLPYYR